MANITKLKNSSYKITVSCGYDVNGKKMRQYMTWKPTSKMTEKQMDKEVQRQAILFEEQCKGGRQVTATVKFEAFAEEYFQMVTSLNKLKIGTITNYRNYSKRVYPKIGHLRLDKITTTHIQRIINEMSESGNSERRDKYKSKPLSAKTIRNHVAFISTVFAYAKKRKILSYNPCEDVELPQNNADEQCIHSIEEVQQIMSWLFEETDNMQYFTHLRFIVVFVGVKFSGWNTRILISSVV